MSNHDSSSSSPQMTNRMKSFFVELSAVFREHKRELVCLSLIAALILLSYSFARGPSESLFLKFHDQSLLPGLWIEMGLASIALVAIYNRLLNYFSLYRLFHASFMTTGVMFAILLSGIFPISEQTITIFGQVFPIGPVTFIRIWCDLYIVLLVETFWSVSNLHFSLKSATLIYGFLGIAGSLGSMLGNTLTGIYAETLGTETLIGLTIPCAVLMSLCLIPLRKTFNTGHHITNNDLETDATIVKTPISTENENTEEGTKKKASFIEGLRVVGQSRYLPLILLLVLSSQVAVTLIDYQYQGLLQTLFTDVNERSAVHAWVYLSIDIGSMIMQLLTGITLTILGVGATLSIIPLILILLCIVPIFTPVFFMIAMGKSASKFMTYSIFKSAKEILYLPLSYEEQTQGKAVIDIMIYRQAKLLTSLILIVLSAQKISSEMAGWFTILVTSVWLAISILLWLRVKHDMPHILKK